MKHIYILAIVFFLWTFVGVGEAALAPEAREWFKQGYQAYEEGNYGKAIRYYEKVAEIDPNAALVYNALGLAHQGNGAPLSDVLWYFRVAVDIDPENQEAYESMCRFYYQAQQFKESEFACKKLLELNPRSMSARMQLAWNYLVGLKQPAEAVPYFEEVLLTVKEPVVYFGLGMAHSLNGDYGQALAIITKLRAMGADEFAAQLENVTRSASYSPPVGPQRMIVFPTGSATLVEAQTPMEPGTSSEDTGVETSHGLLRTTRVRLQGTLTPLPDQEKESQDAPPENHPGSLSPAERIRQLRQRSY